MNRIASLVAAAALLLVATPALAQDDVRSLRREAQTVAFSIAAATDGLSSLKAELNRTWAEARALRAEQAALRDSREATSKAGQARAQELADQMADCKAALARLQGNKAYVVAQRKELRAEQKSVQAALARAQKGESAAFAAR